ncbi:hypothetical protein AAFN47_20290 [Hoeflea sp. CAU 1731]
MSKLWARPQARQYQRSPDKERSIRRRRTLAATYPMPPAMAGMLTTSQLAYARIVADEIQKRGSCQLCLDAIAARGGMCRKTAQRAQDRLAELGWITVWYRKRNCGVRHLPNLVRIVSAEWKVWIDKGPKRSIKTGHSCLTTVTENNITASVPRERPQRALEKRAFRQGRGHTTSGSGPG